MNILIQTICSMLVQSIWLGLILAFVTGVIILSTRNSTAALRYNLLLSVLALFTIALGYSFISTVVDGLMNAGSASINASASAPALIFDGVAPVQAPEGWKTGMTGQLNGFISHYAGLIVMLWLFIVSFRSVKLVTGLRNISQLKHRNLTLASEASQELLQRLSDSLGVKRAAQLATSGIAKMPMVIGHLKPVILMPAGLLLNLPSAEVEAILVHELAHVRRNDYLVNIFQSGLEIIFFFNPAVTWISRLIRTERENCCDDIALQYTGTSEDYIQALISCAEFEPAPSSYAMAISRNKGPLLLRIRRIIAGKNYSLSIMQRGIVFACLVMAWIAVLSFSTAKRVSIGSSLTLKPITGRAKTLQYEPFFSFGDTTPSRKAKKAMLEKQLAEQRANIDLARAGFELAKEEHENNFRNNHDSLLEIEKRELNVMLSRMDSSSFLDKLNAEKSILNNSLALQSEVEQQQIRLAKKQLAELQRTSDSKWRAEYDQSAVTKSNQMYKADQLKLLAEQKYYKQSQENFEKHFRKIKEGMPYSEDYNDKPGNPNQDALIADLISDGIVSEQAKAALSFKLSNKKFIVNGKTQSDEIFKRYRGKYALANDGKDWAWYYHFDTDK